MIKDKPVIRTRRFLVSWMFYNITTQLQTDKRSTYSTFFNYYKIVIGAKLLWYKRNQILYFSPWCYTLYTGYIHDLNLHFINYQTTEFKFFYPLQIRILDSEMWTSWYIESTKHPASLINHHTRWTCYCISLVVIHPVICTCYNLALFLCASHFPGPYRCLRGHQDQFTPKAFLEHFLEHSHGKKIFESTAAQWYELKLRGKNGALFILVC